jgi:predicted nucleotidyltransferase
MIIGGYALPFYGRIRATLDVDLAVAVRTMEEFEQLKDSLGRSGFEVTLGSYGEPLAMVLDLKEGIEIELWMKPDGVVFDEEALRRRRRAVLGGSLSAWVISPEDYIVNKLSRPDRGVVDEQDVKSVLVRQRNKLDVEYLRKRAQDAHALRILEEIERR